MGGNNLKKIIVGMIIFTLLISLSLPVTGFTADPDEKIQTIIKQPIDPKFYPLPGFMSPDHPGFKLQEAPVKNILHHQIEVQSMSDTVIEIIQQMDQDLILGYLEDLVAFGPRVTGEQGCLDAGDYIYNEFESMGLDVRFHDWSYSGYEDRNVEATLEGTNLSSDEIYIICGHFDSVPDSPGADDDGSGTVIAMAAAYIMSQYSFEHDIRFVTFSGEEEGLLGSHEYAAEADANGDNIVAVLNADMIGYAETEEDASKARVFENDFSEWVTDFMIDVNSEYDEYIGLEIIPSGYSYGSDHYSFWQFGYSATFTHEYNFNPHWHQPTDTIENMNMTYDVRMSKLLVASLAEFAQTTIYNTPPMAPTITGPNKGKPEIEYDYEITTMDMDGDRVYFYVDWDDGYVEDWIGPFNSEEIVPLSHMWLEKGVYTVKARARDTYGAESNWTYYEVTMPRNRAINNLFLQFLQNHPNLFPILRLLLGL